MGKKEGKRDPWLKKRKAKRSIDKKEGTRGLWVKNKGKEVYG